MRKKKRTPSLFPTTLERPCFYLSCRVGSAHLNALTQEEGGSFREILRQIRSLTPVILNPQTRLPEMDIVSINRAYETQPGSCLASVNQALAWTEAYLCIFAVLSAQCAPILLSWSTVCNISKAVNGNGSSNGAALIQSISRHFGTSRQPEMLASIESRHIAECMLLRAIHQWLLSLSLPFVFHHLRCKSKGWEPSQGRKSSVHQPGSAIETLEARRSTMNIPLLPFTVRTSGSRSVAKGPRTFLTSPSHSPQPACHCQQKQPTEKGTVAALHWLHRAAVGSGVLPRRPLKLGSGLHATATALAAGPPENSPIFWEFDWLRTSALPNLTPTGHTLVSSPLPGLFFGCLCFWSLRFCWGPLPQKKDTLSTTRLRVPASRTDKSVVFLAPFLLPKLFSLSLGISSSKIPILSIHRDREPFLTLLSFN